MCTINIYRWWHDQFNKNTDGEYLEQMKTFKWLDLTPNKQGYTLERHPTKKQKVGKTELNYDTDDINCVKTGESFVFKELKSKSFKELIQSLTPACDSSQSDDDFDKAFQPLIIAAHRWLSWLSIGLSCGRLWVRLRPDQHSGS